QVAELGQCRKLTESPSRDRRTFEMKASEILELDESFDAGIRNGGSPQLGLDDKWRKTLKFSQLCVVENGSHVGCTQDEAVRRVRRDRNQLRSLRLLHLPNFTHECAVIANRRRFFAVLGERNAGHSDRSR